MQAAMRPRLQSPARLPAAPGTPRPSPLELHGGGGPAASAGGLGGKHEVKLGADALAPLLRLDILAELVAAGGVGHFLCPLVVGLTQHGARRPFFLPYFF